MSSGLVTFSYHSSFIHTHTNFIVADKKAFAKGNKAEKSILMQYITQHDNDDERDVHTSITSI